MELIKSKYLTFYTGKLYPVFIAIIVLIGHTFSLELFTIALVAFSAGFGVLLSCDLRYVLSPALLTFFCLSRKSAFNGEGSFFSAWSIAITAVACSIFAICLILHFIKYRKEKDFKKVKKSPLFWGFVALSSCLLFNGIFYKGGLSFANFLYTIGLILTFFGIFYLFYTSIKFDSTFSEYVIYILYIASLVITIEFFSLFALGQIELVNGQIVKESVVTGWGTWNAIGCYLSMLIPIHFYLACYSKRLSYIFYGTGLLSYLAIVITLSRASLLAGTVVLGISIILSCFKGNNKKSNRIMTLIVCFIGILFIIVFHEKIFNILNDYINRGIDDNGRFEIYSFGMDKFLSHPIFGCGFYSSPYSTNFGIPFLYHNTFVQLLASCGVVGLLGYLFHRYQTLVIIFEKIKSGSIFLSLCILALLITSLLDVHLFSLYPTIYYSILLLAIEKSD